MTISIPIEGKKAKIVEPKTIKETQDYIYANQATSITKGKFNIYIPANSLYEDAYLDISVQGDTLKFHKDVVPIHKNITITVDASNYNKHKNMTLVANCNKYLPNLDLLFLYY